ncbi:toxin glutamine deamidase domain-containing protein [Mycobacterium sp. MMS18-G62]
MWHAAKYLQGVAPDRPNVLLHSEFEASLQHATGEHAVSVTGFNCAHLVADELSAIYDREFRVDGEPTSSGVPARALFEAVGSRSQFATFDEVAQRLRELGDGSSAVLTSRWAHGGGRQGGHAYLAVNEDDKIYLVDSHTGGRTPWPPHWGQDAVARTAVGYLDADGNAVHPLHDVPLQLAAADAIGDVKGHPVDPSNGGSPDPVSRLGLPDHAPASLVDAAARAVYADGELRMRDYNEQLIRDGVGVEQRARIMSELRNSLRIRTRDMMSNRVVADFLAASEANPSFEDLVARNEAKGLVGDGVYEAIIHSATHGHYAAGTLSDVETTSLYSQFEVQMREYNERLLRDGVGVEERARIVCELRSSLRAWTRDLMSNRPAAEWLAANESNPGFEDLVARNVAKGLEGDAVYEAIIHTATHSHYAAATLSNTETRTVYTTFELKMREVSEQLVRDGVDLEERARTLYDLRASLRSWTRALMEDRETAEYLTANEPNPTFEALVERQRAKGRVGDEIYEAIITSATRSRASVNESLGIDPENPPELPPMRGPDDGPDLTEEDTP